VLCSGFDNAFNPDVSGGLHVEHGVPTFVFNRRGKSVYIPTNQKLAPKNTASKIIQDPVIYAGPINHHFGHFIAESCHRLWYALSEDTDRRLAYCSVRSGFGIKLWAQEFLAILGLLDRVFLIDEPVLLRDVIVPEPGKVLGGHASDWYLDWHNRESPLRDVRSDQDKPKRLAVTRGHMPTGRLIGEATLERRLENLGFHLMRAENYSIRDQISFYQSAEKIIFTEGSAFHMLEMLPSLSADVIVLSRRYFGHRLADEALRGKVKSLSVFRDIVSLSPVGNDGKFLAPAWMHVDDALRFLSDNDFIAATDANRSATGEPRHQAEMLEDLLAFVRNRMVTHNRGRPVTTQSVLAEALRLLDDGLAFHATRFREPASASQAVKSARYASEWLNRQISTHA